MHNLEYLFFKCYLIINLEKTFLAIISHGLQYPRRLLPLSSFPLEPLHSQHYILLSVSESEVVLGNGGLGEVETGLVTGEPALVARHGGGIEGGEAKVEVGGDYGRVMLVLGLQGAWARGNESNVIVRFPR